MLCCSKICLQLLNFNCQSEYQKLTQPKMITSASWSQSEPLGRVHTSTWKSLPCWSESASSQIRSAQTRSRSRGAGHWLVSGSLIWSWWQFWRICSDTTPRRSQKSWSGFDTSWRNNCSSQCVLAYCLDQEQSKSTYIRMWMSMSKQIEMMRDVGRDKNYFVRMKWFGF